MSCIDHWARVLWVASGPGSGLADFGRPFTLCAFQNRRGGAQVRLRGWPRPPATLLFSVELQFCSNAA